MHIEFLVEEPSAEAALQVLVPRIVGAACSFRIHPFRSKSDLLVKLPQRLRGYRVWLPEDWRIVVLVDRDREDCRGLKGRLEQMARTARLATPSTFKSGSCACVVNRLAVEELEAWFFGDVEALVTAYPGVPLTLARRAGFRNPDGIGGGTWEALERVLQRAGYYAAGMPKIEVARTVARHMAPERNTSPSFRLFRDTLRRLLDV
jgi:hypothetical protein